MRYKISRIGLLNFWLYDEEEYDFSDGKLLLRGSNGSGKSVTMQSFIPLILDGNKMPSRLDPFGSKDKRIEDYLLGGVDTEQKDEATGYLYMEMYHEAKQKYVTIGMGLHARKGRPTDFWGFALQDGRRIGLDMFLYHNKGGKVPLTKNELRSSLGVENILVESAKEYKKMVNKLIFGFPNLDTYDEFINVLLQLRSPKLSKEYKPTKLMEILNGVLQPLTEDDLRPLSEAIEEMDKTKEKIEKLENDVKQISYLLKTYNNYNETILYKKAESYLEVLKNKDNSSKLVKQLENSIMENESNLKQNEKEFNDLILEKARLEDKKANMDRKDLDSKVKRANELTLEINERQQKKNKLQESLSIKLDKKQDLINENNKLENECYKAKKNFDDVYDDVRDLCDSVKFTEPMLILKDLKKDMFIDVSFTEIKARINDYQRKLEQIKEKLMEKENLELKLNDTEKEYNDYKKSYEELLEKIEIKEDELENELQNIKDEFFLLVKNNKVVKMTSEEQKEVTRFLNHYTHTDFMNAKEKYETLAMAFHKQLLNEFYNLKEKLSLRKEKYTNNLLYLEELKAKKEEELPLDEDDKETIDFLTRENINFINFYKAVEFKDNLSLEEKNKLESVLLTSGILGAKIIDAKNIEKVSSHKGNYLFASSKKANNLTKYLVASNNDNISSEVITSVLESISINDEDDIYVNTDGYKLDFISGYGSKKREAKYIGILLRQHQHQLKIAEQEAFLKEEEALIKNLERQINQKNEELDLVLKEKDAFPKENKLFEIAKIKDGLVIEAQLINKKQLKLEDAIRNLTQLVDKVFRILNDLKKGIDLPLYLESYKETLVNVLSLKNELSNLEMALKSYQQKNELYFNKGQQLVEIENTLDEINGDINIVQNELERKEFEKKDLDALLNTGTYRDLSNILLEIDSRLKEIEDKQLSVKKMQGDYERALVNSKRELENADMVLKKVATTLEFKEKFFAEEYNLHYVLKEEITDIKSMAKKVINKFASRKDSDMGNVMSNYYDAYNDYRLKLNDYHLMNVNLFEYNDLENAVLSEEEMRQLYAKSRRMDFSTMYQGKKLNLYALTETLEEAIMENNEIISEQDRHLFEEVLLKTVGTKIREHIESSKEWVKKINTIMKKVQENSALSFQLEWRSKGAESIEELDTKELVRLFQIDASIIAPSDSDKLIEHFRSKLKRRVEMLMDNRDTYANIIFEVLDYRSWFEFKMTYTRTGDRPKELTDKVFSVFSGGEKAKTMYIPLFAAVYAKLMGANSDALRIVALDEAFAGVDDSNIREMFGIMSLLDLDYILTSQALWGDYDTVSNLSIAELIRPKNSPVVGVKRYHWNGKVKEVILKRKIEDASIIF